MCYICTNQKSFIIIFSVQYLRLVRLIQNDNQIFIMGDFWCCRDDWNFWIFLVFNYSIYNIFFSNWVSFTKISFYLFIIV